MKQIFALLITLSVIASPAFAKKNVNGVEVLTEITELADPAHSAVIVIDMQNEIVSTQGGYSRPDRSAPANPSRHAVIPRFKAQVEHMQRLLQAARESGVLVIYAQYIHRDQSGRMIVNGPECWTHYRGPWVSCAVAGTWEAETIQELAPQASEITIKKARGDAFYNTYLDDLLHGKGVTNLILTGTPGGGCVFATAMGAMERGYYPVYVSDCVDQPQFIQLAIKGRFPIYRSDEILTVWQSARRKITSQSAIPKRLP
jgi:nicotinamidase-related amidase